MLNQISVYNSINAVMMRWNPLSVDGAVLAEEYLGIIPSLMKLSVDKNQIAVYLTEVIEQHYGVNFDEEEIALVSNEIFQLLLHKNNDSSI